MHRRTISLRTIGFATCILVASALAASSVGAQVVPAQTFTAPGLDASPQQSANCNTGVLQVSGTGSWTVVPQGSNDNGVTYVTISTIGGGSITGSGTFSGSVAGYAASFFRFNVSAVSGSVTVTKSCTSQILPSSGGGGSYTAPPVQAVAPAASSSPFPVAIVTGGGSYTAPPTQAVVPAAGSSAFPVSASSALPAPYGAGTGQTAGASSFIGEALSNGTTVDAQRGGPAGTAVANGTAGISYTQGIGSFGSSPVVQLGLANFVPTQVSVSTSAVSIVAARTGVTGTGRYSVTVYNSSTSAPTVYIGGSGVTATTGLPILPGGSVTLQTQAALYGITSTGTATVSEYELY